MPKKEDRVNPITLTIGETQETYTLDFSRESVRFAEQRDFAVADVLRLPTLKVPEFFFYAFRKNHKNLSKGQTDEILETMGGISTEILERLIQLYNQAGVSHVIASEDDGEKNARVTVEM